MQITKTAWLDDCREACKRIKSVSQKTAWNEKPSKSNWLVSESLLFDINGVAIPHIYIKGEYAPRKFGDVVTYALMYRKEKIQHRIFMLEVYPEHVRSHRDQLAGIEIFGPHIHLGDERLDQITRACKTKIETILSNGWIERFTRHTSILQAPQSLITAPPMTSQSELFG